MSNNLSLYILLLSVLLISACFVSQHTADEWKNVNMLHQIETQTLLLCDQHTCRWSCRSAWAV